LRSAASRKQSFLQILQLIFLQKVATIELEQVQL
jgi:hypothetical protein